MEALHEGRALFNQPFTAQDHLAGADTGLLGQTPQRQTVETQLDHSLLLSLQLVFAVGALSGFGGMALEEGLQLGRVTVGGDNEVAHLMKTGGRAVILQHHGEPLQAPGVQTKPSGQQTLVEGVEGAVMFSDGLDWSQPLHVDYLSPTKEEADPLLQPLCLLLQATIAGKLLKQFGPLMMNIHGSQHDVS